MRIVIFIDWFAPAYKAGGPIQSIANLVNQPLEGVAYKIICSNKDLDGQVLPNVRSDEWVSFNAQTQVWYNSDKKKILRLLKSLSDWQPDIYFINGIYSLYYNLLPILFGKAGKKIISARGMLHTGALSQKGAKKRFYLRVWKLLNIPRKHCFHATNQEEERFIKAAFGQGTTVYLAANLPRILQTASVRQKRKNSLTLISIGLISPMKNYLEVLKALRGCEAQIEYTIFGPVKDAEYWQKCREEIKKLPPNISVSHKGDLPSAKVPDALSKAHVFVLPSKSENFGHALYEALTAGIPVITSHGTPWNNLKGEMAGININPQNDYELSKAICFFAATDATELTKWSEGAKVYAKNAIDLNSIRRQYQQMFQL